MQPLVSVLIPCYNCASVVGETIEAVLRQSWKRLEVLVVDDGSSDTTLSELAKFRDVRLNVHHQQNRGAAAARNAALERSTGHFVQFLDADDLISTDKIRIQVERLQCAPLSVAISSWARFTSQPEEAYFPENKLDDPITPADWAVATDLSMQFPAMWLIPRQVVLATGRWNERLSLADDREYFTRMLVQIRSITVCPEARAYYRSGNTDSLSGRKSRLAWSSAFAAEETVERFLMILEDSERIRALSARAWRSLAFAAYPYAPELSEAAIARAQELAPWVQTEPGGGKLFFIASKLMGWRLARRLQVLSGRSG